MLQKRRAENRHLRRAIPRVVQNVALPVVLVDRHRIAQIAAVSLLQVLLVRVAHQAVILAVDHEENRSEDNNEKLHN